MGHVYSRWDGSQAQPEMDAEGLIDSMADELMAHGDVWKALRRMLRDGSIQPSRNSPGLEQMLRGVQQARQEKLGRHDMGSVFDQYRERLEQIVTAERGALDKRREAADALRREDPQSSAARTLDKLISRRSRHLDRLPGNVPGDLRHLREHEFFSVDAEARLQELFDEVRAQVGGAMFRRMADNLRNWGEAERGQMRQVMADLNEMLRRRADGQDPRFEEFMARHGAMFGEPPPATLDELLEMMYRQVSEMESFLNSLPPDQRREMDSLIEQLMADEGLRWEMAMLGRQLAEIWPDRPMGEGHRFRGEESLSTEEAMNLMGELREMDELEQSLQRAGRTGDLEGVDREQLQALLGEEAASGLDNLREVVRALEREGFVEMNGDRLELTPVAINRIGRKVLEDVFGNLQRDQFGRHPLRRAGAGGDRIDETKDHEFGDPFLLDLHGTVMNAIQRGATVPVSLHPQDFVVHRTESLTRSATVLMVDMSRSMWLRGCFLAAKKVAVALDSLIRSRYPQDSLYVVGFARYARELKPAGLHTLDWDEDDYGTNLQHGLMVARRLLARHGGGNRQVIVITDGEPTAHLEDGRAIFNYPPTVRTIQETLREVTRCTRENIVINTFMLERGGHLAEFVNRMSRINRGRAFFVEPEHLGRYVLVDYLDGKRRQAG